MTGNENVKNRSKPLAVETHLEQWRIEQVLGRTRSGFLYLANNQQTGNSDFLYEFFPDWNLRRRDGCTPQIRVKEKVLFQEGLERFLVQAHSWSQVHDLHLQPVIHYGEHHGTAILVTACGPGRTLHEMIQKRSHPVDEQQLRLFLQAGLQALHALGLAHLVHADISPKTLFLPELASPCLLAFGVTGFSTGCTPLTCYQPIEVEQNTVLQSPQTDLYSLGASLYHTLAGQPPVMANTRMDAMARGQNDPLIPAVEIGHGRYNHTLTGAIDWMLSPLLRDRPEHPETLLGQIIRPQAMFRPVASGSDFAAQNNTRESTNTTKFTAFAEDDATGQTIAAPDAPLISEFRSLHKPGSKSQIEKKKSFYGAKILASGIILLGFVTYFLYQLDSSSTPAKKPTTSEAKSPPNKTNNLAVNMGPPPITKGLPTRSDDQQRITTYRKINLEDKIRKEIAQQMEADAAAADQAQEKALAKEEKQRQQQIDLLWKKIALARKNAHYLWPRKGSVKQLLVTVQRLQPDSVQARELQQDLSCWLLALAEYHRQANEPHQAYLALLQASAFNADESLLQSALKRQQKALKDSRNIVLDTAQNVKRTKAKQLLVKARRAYSLGYWFAPPGGNALGMFRAALNMDPGNIAARDGLRQIDQQLKRRFHRAIQQNDKSASMKWLTGLQALNPDDPELLALEKQAIQLKSTSHQIGLNTPAKSIKAKSVKTAAALSTKTKKNRAPIVKRPRATPKNPTAISRNSSKIETETISSQLQQAIDAYHKLQYLRAYELLQPLVKKRIPRALFRSGMILMEGKGIERDRVTALNQLEMALPSVTQLSLQGKSWAQVALGLYFDKGWLMQSSAGTAVALYRKAALAGNADAMNNLGLMYASGRGVVENFTTAKYWLQRAKQLGHKLAAANFIKLEQLIENRAKRKRQNPVGFSGN
ncbi:MAG TPA: hypothetical protein ENI62_00635 [Gammaproteobacteria bacterium]|nr:hypothetical protein [Gammaproteobacteria bacterium]